MTSLDKLSKAVTFCSNLFMQASRLLIKKDSFFALPTMIAMVVYLFAVFYFANLLYLLFVDHKGVKGGDKNFKLFPTATVVPLIVIAIFEASKYFIASSF